MSRKTTWHSPDGQTNNQIDYILKPQRFKSSIIKTSTRTYPGATINSDHDLVLCNIKMKLCLKKKKEIIESDTTLKSYETHKLQTNTKKNSN